MKTRILLTLILQALMRLAADAQWTGGNGRGDVAVRFTPAPIGSNIFTGGNGRGDVATWFTPTPIISNIFSGGNGRGDVATWFTPIPIISNVYSGGNGRGDVALLFIPEQLPEQLLLAVRGKLEGPYDAATGLMNDALRTLAVIPLNEPYTALGYTHVGGGGESVPPSVLATTGNNAIVDWVVIELRAAAAPGTVLATRCALIQRDGDVVAADGTSPVTFLRIPGAYHVALRHRNHLGVMSASPIGLSTSATTVDFSVPGSPPYGGMDAVKIILGTFSAQALWAGDVTFNGQVKYTGTGNDRDPILTTVGSTTPNNTVLNIYSTRDVNLNGQVKYTGSGNDRDPILVNVGSTTPNNVRLQQLP